MNGFPYDLVARTREKRGPRERRKVANEAFDGVEARGGSVADVETGKRGGDSLARQAIIKLFDDTRKRLVETGIR
jgi:hypothetical protein